MQKLYIITLLPLLAVSLLVSQVHSEQIESQPIFPDTDFSLCTAYEVTRVIDGDTIEATDGSKNITIRLQGVDSPETKHPRKPVQAYGKEATEFLTNLLKGEKVYLLPVKDQFHMDEFGRIIAYVYRAPDGLFVNAEIIRQGYGHAYPKYPGKYTDKFLRLEQLAKQAKKGLWSEDDMSQATRSQKPDLATKLPAAYMIEDYRFWWTAAESGKANIQIDKSDGNPATVSINQGGVMSDSISVSPANAVKIGVAFAQTNNYHKAMKGKKDHSEAITAGEYKVIFFTSKEGAFYVNVRKSEGYVMSSVALTRKQASELSQALKDSPKLAAYIDAKVKF